VIVSNKMRKLIRNQDGWTRKMFDKGMQMKKTLGEDKVYDFSLGNPDVEPPVALKSAVIDMLAQETVGMHKYMENNGYQNVREEIAGYLKNHYCLPFTDKHVFMSVGCAGGINVLFKSILNRGDEVIVPNPFFWEFKNYIENYGGVMKLVETKDDFQLDIEKIEEAIGEKTKIILINSPNNPTGVIYSRESLEELASLLYKKRREGKEIYIVADEAYKKIVFEDSVLPNIFGIYDLVISVTSHSKDLALPGERIGYIAISPNIGEIDLLISGLIIAMRALGFVNAPALFQRAAGMFQENSVDIMEYKKKRDILYSTLIESGFECVKPGGAFYLFPKSPSKDEIPFVKRLQSEERILVVPGSGFGRSGYFRIAYCVNMEKIINALDGFRRLGKQYQ